jgi:hypothetical protein
LKFKLSLLAVLLFSSPLFAQDAGAVIEKYIGFIGGEKEWKKIKTMTTSGEYDYGGIKFPFSSYAMAPNRYKFVVPFNGKFYAQGFDGSKGWKIDAFKNETTPTALTGKPALAMANESDVELEDPFIHFQNKGHHVVLEGLDTAQGRNCFRIYFARSNGDTATYFFDQKSYKLIRKIAPSRNPELSGASLVTDYSDYRNVGHIKIPFKAVSTSNGQMVLTITVEKAEVNPLMDEREFQPTQ